MSICRVKGSMSRRQKGITGSIRHRKAKHGDGIFRYGPDGNYFRTSKKDSMIAEYARKSSYTYSKVRIRCNE